MKELERNIEARVVRWAKARGMLTFKMNTWGNFGWPDRLFLVPGGAVVFIEFKRKGGKATQLQQKCVNQLNSMGFAAYILDNSDEAISTLETVSLSATSG